MNKELNEVPVHHPPGMGLPLAPNHDLNDDGACKVLTLHGLLTRHVAHARAWYRCYTAVYTASTLEVQHRTHSELEFRLPSDRNITTGFGSKSKTT